MVQYSPRVWGTEAVHDSALREQRTYVSPKSGVAAKNTRKGAAATNSHWIFQSKAFFQSGRTAKISLPIYLGKEILRNGFIFVGRGSRRGFGGSGW